MPLSLLCAAPSEVCPAEETFLFDFPGTLFWPPTEAGVLQTLSCPFSEFGSITRRCGLDGVWLEPQTENCFGGIEVTIYSSCTCMNYGAQGLNNLLVM